jgi:hypothetical protein
MNLKDVVREIENEKSMESLMKKRFVCAHCVALGPSW